MISMSHFKGVQILLPHPVKHWQILTRIDKIWLDLTRFYKIANGIDKTTRIAKNASAPCIYIDSKVYFDSNLTINWILYRLNIENVHNYSFFGKSVNSDISW